MTPPPTSAAVVWRWDLAEAFGDTPADDNPNGFGSFSFNQRFSGQVFDAETGQHHNGHRDYSPATGRYVQSDPLGLVGGINTFSYVRSSPLLWVDPLGLQVTTVDSWCRQNPAACAEVLGARPSATPVPLPIAPQSWWDQVMEMAQGGKQNIDNEYTREVKNLGKECEDPCKYLREKYNNETESKERLKIKAAMKYFNCDGKDRFK